MFIVYVYGISWSSRIFFCSLFLVWIFCLWYFGVYLISCLHQNPLFSIHHFGLDSFFWIRLWLWSFVWSMLWSHHVIIVIIQVLLWFSDRSDVSDFVILHDLPCSISHGFLPNSEECQGLLERPVIQAELVSRQKVRMRTVRCDEMWLLLSDIVRYVWSLLKQVKQWRHQHHNIITLLSMYRRPAPDPPDQVRGAYRTISAGRGWDPCNLVSIWSSSIGRKSQVLYGSHNQDLKHCFISFTNIYNLYLIEALRPWGLEALIDASCNWIEWSARAMSNVIKLNLLPQDQRQLSSVRRVRHLENS